MTSFLAQHMLDCSAFFPFFFFF